MKAMEKLARAVTKASGQNPDDISSATYVGNEPIKIYSYRWQLDTDNVYRVLSAMRYNLDPELLEKPMSEVIDLILNRDV